MRGAFALALSLAVVAASANAAAQEEAAAPSGGGFNARLRLEGVYAHQFGLPPPNDGSGQAAPEVGYTFVGKRSEVAVTYEFTGNLHSALPNDISNRAVMASSFELSPRTRFLVSAEAGQSSIRNRIVNAGADAAPVGIVPSPSVQFFDSRVSESTSTEVTPVLRFDQTVDGTYIRTIDTPALSAGMLVNAVGTLERSWTRDGLGLDARVGYLNSRADPLPREQIVPVGLTPHWRSDISPSVSALFVTGAWMVVSPYADSRTLVRPWAQGTVTYLFGSRSLEVNGAYSPLPNPLTAQLLAAAQATARITTPLNERETVRFSSTFGYLHATVVQLRRAVPTTPDLDSFIADAQLSWLPAPFLELFARYQFLDQLGASATTPDLVRHAAILGVSLSTVSESVRVPTRFSPRVDRANGQVGEPPTVAAPPPATPPPAPTEDE